MLNANLMTDAEVAKAVADLLARHTKQNPSQWTAETELEAIGVDSFDFVEFVFLVEDTFGIEIEYNANDMSKGLTSIGTVASAIKSVAAGTSGTRLVETPSVMRQHANTMPKIQPA